MTRLGRTAWSTVALAGVLGLTACPGGTEGGDGTNPTESGSSSSDTGAAASKLAAYTDDLCPLLPEALVRAEVPEMPAEVEHSIGSKSLRLCSYSWAGPRRGSREIANRVIGYPIDDTVQIMWLRVLKVDEPLARFQRSYRTMTPEEQEQAAAAFKKALDRQTEKGELTETGRELGESMGTSMLTSQTYEAVEGVGTAAAWGGIAGQASLKVLDQDTEFELTVDVYEDKAKNRAAAIALAKKIIANAQ